MDESGPCPFVGCGCDGGAIHADGTVGCGFKEHPDALCAWMDELPPNTSPRDFYNAAVMEAMRA